MVVDWAKRQLKKKATQYVVWLLSAWLTSMLLPLKALFFVWCLVSGYGLIRNKSHLDDEEKKAIAEDWGKSNFVKLSDVTIHYVEAGDRSKPLMLCLHGFPEFWFSWRYQLREFSTTHWVVAVDMRGYGESGKPSGKDEYKMTKLVEDVREIIKKLSSRSYKLPVSPSVSLCQTVEGGDCDVLLAHDWGAIVAWHFVSRYPEMVNKFIPMNFPHPAAYVKTATTEISQALRSWYILFFQLPYVPELVFTSFDCAFLRFSLERSGKEMKSIEGRAYLEQFKKPGDITAPINYYRNIFTDEEGLLYSENLKIQVPTLLIWGAKDKYLNISAVTLSSKWMEGPFEFEIIPDATHWVQQAQPDKVNNSIRNFLERTY